jgi:hypothetical protein
MEWVKEPNVSNNSANQKGLGGCMPVNWCDWCPVYLCWSYKG